MAQEAQFKILIGKDGGYYWHLQAANNRIVCWSGQTYASKQSCVNELEWIRSNASSVKVFDYTGEAR